MKSKILLLMLVVALFLGACAKAEAPVDNLVTEPTKKEMIETSLLDFQVMDKTALSEESQTAIDERKNESGSYLFEEGEKAYLAVFAGEYPTGGYEIVIREVLLDGMIVKASVEVTQPGPDMMVTDALTYPLVVVELKDLGNVDDLSSSMEIEIGTK